MKKALILVLSLVLIAVFAVGCTTKEETTENTAPEATVEATTEEATEETTEEATEETTEEVTEETTEEVTEETTEEAPVVMTYAEYVAAELETPVVVETYVQDHQSWWDNKITVYLQSEDGAYFAYELACSEEDAAKLVPGTKIRISGFKGEFSGEVEILDGTFEFVEGGDTFIAEALDVTELLGTEAIDEHMNQKVAFKALTVEAIDYKNGEPGDDIYLTLGYNGASYSFCVEVYLTGTESDVYTTVGTLNVGDVVDVEAFLYYYEGINPHVTSITVAAAE